MMTENEITEVIIGCAIKVHKSLEPGLLEAAYEESPLRRMSYEKKFWKLKTKTLPLMYEEVKLDCGYT